MPQNMVLRHAHVKVHNGTLVVSFDSLEQPNGTPITPLANFVAKGSAFGKVSFALLTRESIVS